LETRATGSQPIWSASDLTDPILAGVRPGCHRHTTKNSFMFTYGTRGSTYPKLATCAINASPIARTH
jgi:hypothetical protein